MIRPFAFPAPLLLLLTLAACTSRDAVETPEAVGAAYTAPTDSLADSLALSLPDGGEVWYSFGRPARGPDGGACTERTLEIRREGGRVRVPLLYTRDTPAVVDDSTIEARISENCVPAALYRIDLRTGRPTPVR